MYYVAPFGGYPAGSGSKKMRTGTETGLDRFHILGTGTRTNHIGSKAVPVPKAGTRFRCSPLVKMPRLLECYV